MVKEITDETFEEFINTNELAVLDCWAAWCGPCRFLSPMMEELAGEHKDVAFGKLNVDENMQIPMKFGIMSIPTLLYFKGGDMVNKTVGVLPKGTLEEVIERLKK
ncbi:thioredoxin [Candidatus Bathyarchaeota archaeon]|nr:thioredoxin [Candidatus Bathyarchaeota archaeon]